MKKILITGMSGTGKSSVLEELARRGWVVVDTDYGTWKVPGADGDLIWDEDKLHQLLSNAPENRHLAVDGCVSNQGRFYDRFDAIVLLTAPIEVMLERVVTRTTNNYGKTAAEREEIRVNTEFVMPQLRATADIEIDTSRLPLHDDPCPHQIRMNRMHISTRGRCAATRHGGHRPLLRGPQLRERGKPTHYPDSVSKPSTQEERSHAGPLLLSTRRGFDDELHCRNDGIRHVVGACRLVLVTIGAEVVCNLGAFADHLGDTTLNAFGSLNFAQVTKHQRAG